MSKKLDFSYINPAKLVKNRWNPNEMSPEAEAKLRTSLSENGHIRPILVRELADGTLEIVGGEHRVDISLELGHAEVPVLNLGPIDDAAAKKALLLDNSRYGEDEAGKLSALLGDLGTAEELAQWTNLTEDDLSALMAPVDADLASLDALDELGMIDEEDFELPTRELQTHQTMKFKIDVENADIVKDVIEAVIRDQGIDDSDATIRAGEALMWLVRQHSSAGEPASLTEAAELDALLEMEKLDD